MVEASVAILGQGLAGSLLSFRLTELSIAHHVYDPGHGKSASRAAAGLVNPVTGRRFVLVAGYQDRVSLFGVYRRLSAKLGIPLARALTIYRDLSQPEARNRWDLRRLDPVYQPYLEAPISAGVVFADLGFGERDYLGPTSGAYRVDLPGLIAHWREVLRESGQLITQSVTAEETSFAETHISILGRNYTNVIDARGAASAKTGLWDHLPWRLTKGEALRFAQPTWPRELATKLSGNFCTPVGEGGELWFGGTSLDHYAEEDPSETIQAQLLDEVTRLQGLPTTPIEALAAIRPTMRNQEWVAERHPRFAQLIACNGLGTRGALDAPSAVEACLSILDV